MSLKLPYKFGLKGDITAMSAVCTMRQEESDLPILRVFLFSSCVASVSAGFQKTRPFLFDGKPRGSLPRNPLNRIVRFYLNHFQTMYVPHCKTNRWPWHRMPDFSDPSCGTLPASCRPNWTDGDLRRVCHLSFFRLMGRIQLRAPHPALTETRRHAARCPAACSTADYRRPARLQRVPGSFVPLQSATP
jgi:hypothetical protein